ncbi:MAG TPA: bifunctional hydroxymethylpyrimidine kinase/phosphomethylpyrimidine kinase [Verrucomicrobiales bacterium]|nr:bifunctional hydroxymethylpyrimidine kinase/phosphomethylpyrimidine kinase [Verrucomicrobiales bacterium]
MANTGETTISSALTIAGSDSGGGAGIQADLKTFAAFKVHGSSVISCLTAQNPNRILKIQSCPSVMVRSQLEAVFEEFSPRALKIGLVGSQANRKTIAEFLSSLNKDRMPFVVLDPILAASSGRRLMTNFLNFQKTLIPIVDLLTPNLPEAEVLAGRPIHSLNDMKSAAQIIHRHYGCGVLIKGGHLPDDQAAVDVLFSNNEFLLFSHRRISGMSIHGTGCTLSSAITAGIAKGQDLQTAVGKAKKYLTKAIRHSYRVGPHRVLGH